MTKAGSLSRPGHRTQIIELMREFQVNMLCRAIEGDNEKKCLSVARNIATGPDNAKALRALAGIGTNPALTKAEKLDHIGASLTEALEALNVTHVLTDDSTNAVMKELESLLDTPDADHVFADLLEDILACIAGRFARYAEGRNSLCTYGLPEGLSDHVRFAVIKFRHGEYRLDHMIDIVNSYIGWHACAAGIPPTALVDVRSISDEMHGLLLPHIHPLTD